MRKAVFSITLGTFSALCFCTAAWSDPTDPDILPPEVTIPLQMPPQTVPTAQTAAPQAAPSKPMSLEESQSLGFNRFRSSTVPQTPPGAPAAGMAPPSGSSAFMPKNPIDAPPFDPTHPATNKRLPKSMPQMETNPASNSGESAGPDEKKDCIGCDQHKKNQDTSNMLGAVPPSQNQAAPSSSSSMAARDPIAVVETTKGTVTIRLFRQHAPKTVGNFIDLASKGFFNGLTWHRVVPGFCVQTGCPKGDGTGNYTDPATNQTRHIPLEISPKLRHNAPGVVAMARFGQNPNSASSQWYITLSPQSHLDQKYSVFGGVVSGMDVVNQIGVGDKVIIVSVQEQDE